MKGKKKILIADDDPAIVEAIQMIFENEGYEVDKSKDAETIVRIEKGQPHLILLDFWMLGTDGWDICRQLKRQEKTKHIPIIMMSADKDTKQIAHEAGADGYLIKPFGMNDLLKKVKQHIQG